MWKGLGLGRRGGVAAKTCAAIGRSEHRVIIALGRVDRIDRVDRVDRMNEAVDGLVCRLSAISPTLALGSGAGNGVLLLAALFDRSKLGGAILAEVGGAEGFARGGQVDSEPVMERVGFQRALREFEREHVSA